VLELSERCGFVRASADEVAGVGEASVDVVTTRSVLIYVERKARAFAEFFRVLRPGGRISLFEPINRFATDEQCDGFWWYPTDGLAELAARIQSVYDAIQPPSDPMLDFDERDLVRFAQEAGFFPIELELRAEVKPVEPRPWASFLNSSGNPKIPTFAEAMDRALTPEERREVTKHLQPLVEQGAGTWRMATAFLTAVKPA